MIELSSGLSATRSKETSVSSRALRLSSSRSLEGFESKACTEPNMISGCVQRDCGELLHVRRIQCGDGRGKARTSSSVGGSRLRLAVSALERHFRGRAIVFQVSMVSIERATSASLTPGAQPDLVRKRYRKRGKRSLGQTCRRDLELPGQYQSRQPGRNSETEVRRQSRCRIPGPRRWRQVAPNARSPMRSAKHAAPNLTNRVDRPATGVAHDLGQSCRGPRSDRVHGPIAGF